MASNIATAARAAYALAFQYSPIFLTGGIAGNTPLPVIGLVGQLAGFAQGFLANGFSAQDFYATFLPLPGATAISNAVGTYPFANQNVAANAIINQPLQVALKMLVPMKNPGDYLTKLPLFTSLQQSFATHNSNGGTYTVATPSYIYTNCIMTQITDVSQSPKLQQIEWQIDFVQPLISLQQASAALNKAMAMMAGGQQTNGSLIATQSATSGIPQAFGDVTQFLSGAL